MGRACPPVFVAGLPALSLVGGTIPIKILTLSSNSTPMRYAIRYPPILYQEHQAYERVHPLDLESGGVGCGVAWRSD